MTLDPMALQSEETPFDFNLLEIINMNLSLF